MTDKPNKTNGNSPATQHDLALLGGQLTERIDSVSNRLDNIEQTMATKDDLKNFATKDDLKNFATKDDLKNFATKDDIQRILTIVESIDNHFKEHKDLPTKVEQLEADVFKLQTHR